MELQTIFEQFQVFLIEFELYNATGIILSLRDYVHKNVHFTVGQFVIY